MNHLQRTGGRYTLFLAICLVTHATAQARGGDLSPRQRAILGDQIAPAYRAGRGEQLLLAINRLFGLTKPAELETVDRLLKQQNLPSLGRMALDARLSFMQRGAAFEKPRAGQGELLALLPEFIRQANAEAMQLTTSPVITGQIEAKSLSDYQERFRQLQSAQQKAGYLADVSQRITKLIGSSRIARSKLDDKSKQLLDEEHPALSTKLQQLHQRTLQRDIEIRLHRLRQSVAVLKQSNNIKERILAAHFLDYDGTTIEDFFRQSVKRPPFASSSLNRDDLAAEVTSMIQQGRDLSGDLGKKARLFYTGTHWWLRGRYGFGPDFFGLVKTRLALRPGPARSYVDMPSELPKGEGSKYDYPDRRHYYTWQWEERTLQVATNTVRNKRPQATPQNSQRPRTPPPGHTGSSKLVSIRQGGLRGGGGGGGFGFSGSAGQKIRIPRGANYGPINRPYSWSLEDVYNKLGYGDYYKKQQKSRAAYAGKSGKSRSSRSSGYTTYAISYIRKQDPNLIYRLVGAVEYRNALDCFNWLIDNCTEAELAAFDELIRERPEFEIEINLSRTVDHQPSPLDPAPARPGDKFLRHGLKWVTALARSELAAMQLGFASDGDAFARMLNRFDRDEYRQLVMDSMRTHYWTLLNEPMLDALTAGKAGVNRTLAHFRRVAVAEGFLDAANFLAGQDLNPAQRQELSKWKKNLNSLQAVLAARLKGFHKQGVINR